MLFMKTNTEFHLKGFVKSKMKIVLSTLDVGLSIKFYIQKNKNILTTDSGKNIHVTSTLLCHMDSSLKDENYV